MGNECREALFCTEKLGPRRGTNQKVKFNLAAVDPVALYDGNAEPHWLADSA